MSKTMRMAEVAEEGPVASVKRVRGEAAGTEWGEYTCFHAIDLDVFTLLFVAFGYYGWDITACLLTSKNNSSEPRLFTTAYLAVSVLCHGG